MVRDSGEGPGRPGGVSGQGRDRIAFGRHVKGRRGGS